MGSYKLRALAAANVNNTSSNFASAKRTDLAGQNVLEVLVEVPDSAQGSNGNIQYNTLFRVLVNGAPYLPTAGTDTSGLGAGGWMLLNNFHHSIPLRRDLGGGNPSSAELDVWTTDTVNGHAIDVTLITDGF